MDILSELVSFLQEVSPLVWQSLIKQVYSEAVGYIIWSIVLVGVSVMFIRFAKSRLEYDDSDILGVFACLFAVIAIPISLLLLASAIQHFINPEFYAIRFILQGIGGG